MILDFLLPKELRNLQRINEIMSPFVSIGFENLTKKELFKILGDLNTINTTEHQAKIDYYNEIILYFLNSNA